MSCGERVWDQPLLRLTQNWQAWQTHTQVRETFPEDARERGILPGNLQPYAENSFCSFPLYWLTDSLLVCAKKTNFRVIIKALCPVPNLFSSRKDCGFWNQSILMSWIRFLSKKTHRQVPWQLLLTFPKAPRCPAAADQVRTASVHMVSQFVPTSPFLTVSTSLSSVSVRE